MENEHIGPETEVLIPVNNCQEHTDLQKSVVIYETTNDKNNFQMTAEPIKTDTGGFESNSCKCSHSTAEQLKSHDDDKSESQYCAQHVKGCLAGFKSHPSGLEL